jgi:hypothetical protein
VPILPEGPHGHRGQECDNAGHHEKRAGDEKAEHQEPLVHRLSFGLKASALETPVVTNHDGVGEPAEHPSFIRGITLVVCL